MASRTGLLPLNANERLDTPPEVSAPWRFCFIHLTASMKSTAYLACSSIPVPMDRMLTSKIISSGAIPACPVNSLYALSQISILRAYVVAWPSSSNAMTTNAAPNCLIVLAFSTNASGPSFRLMEFTMHLPCAFLRPARMVSQCEESIMSAAFATAGSFEMWRTKRSISLVLSSMASSMLMSMMAAPSSICLAAICRASSYLPSDMSLANFLEPATFVLSPTLVKLLCLRSTVTASSPLTFRCLPSVKMPFFADGRMSRTAPVMALICSGVVPQHPPTMLTRPFSAISLICAAISSGLWS